MSLQDQKTNNGGGSIMAYGFALESDDQVDKQRAPRLSQQRSNDMHVKLHSLSWTSGTAYERISEYGLSLKLQVFGVFSPLEATLVWWAVCASMVRCTLTSYSDSDSVRATPSLSASRFIVSRSNVVESCTFSSMVSPNVCSHVNNSFGVADICGTCRLGVTWW